MRVLQQALQSPWVDAQDKSLIFHDLDLMRERLARLQEAFPPGTLHAVAIKANPLVSVLRALVEAGAGLEAASWEEVQLALAAGCPAERIVYDSPAKTRHELAQALQLGVRVNADNLEELERLHELQPTTPVGLRLNPQLPPGAIALTSVAEKGSKFGVPLEGLDLPALFERYGWLNGLHVHVGSQGCSLDQLVAGVASLWTAALEVEKRLPGRLTSLDVGGGLPVDYRETGQVPQLPDYVAALSAACPGWGQSRFSLITEFGRWIQGPSGWLASRVEYVKPGHPDPLVVIHVGADMLLRLAYHPQDWQHQMRVVGAQGQPKPGGLSAWTVVGPLCFGGDVLGRGVQLAAVEPGDWLVISDVGAYTLGMWSHHCSRAVPRVLGLNDGELVQLKARQTAQEVVRFWS